MGSKGQLDAVTRKGRTEQGSGNYRCPLESVKKRAEGTRKMASESLYLEIWLREQGGLGFWETEEMEGDLISMTHFDLQSGSFNT